MLRRILRALGIEQTQRASAAGLLSISREDIAPFLAHEHGFPQVDWGAIQMWLDTKGIEPARRDDWTRAVAAAWLDEVRDAVTDDHRRWRHAQVEGVAPMEGGRAQRIAQSTDRAITSISRSLARIRGPSPIPPFALVALSTREHYYSFTSHFYPEEGEWGTSGGVYLYDGSDSFPTISLPTDLKWAVEQTIAHELTHHALRDVGLPLWIEEGITQMMEERVTGVPNFQLDREMLNRHRERWLEGDLDLYVSGAAFASADGDTQELAYHLSQLVVRSLLETRPEQFFAFAQACRRGIDESMEQHLNCTANELIERALETR